MSFCSFRSVWEAVEGICTGHLCARATVLERERETTQTLNLISAVSDTHTPTHVWVKQSQVQGKSHFSATNDSSHSEGSLDRQTDR